VKYILYNENKLFKYIPFKMFEDIMIVLIFKGLVHPKMKIKSLITHPHAVPTP